MRYEHKKHLKRISTITLVSMSMLQMPFSVMNEPSEALLSDVITMGKF